ncbi:MAG TPA: hypothetical protein VMT99_00240 [Candidatus Paceibacterota bacterium]|nr:hypothetical protein [Candidatus Paceibacterota bacterium]
MTKLYYHWINRPTAGEFRTGVSLHGHTSRSNENLAFLPGVIEGTMFLPSVMRWAEKHHRRKWHEEFDYSRGYWNSPVLPEQAYDLEAKQIADEGLEPLVSLTDHDAVAACAELRAKDRPVPTSLEWTAPYKTAVFHIGLHNIPQEHADGLLKALRDYTAKPDPATLRDILKHTHGMPDALIVLNHPLSDQGRIGFEIHVSMVDDFLSNFGDFIHALELNALQPWDMNRRVAAIGTRVRLPLISGGDRHGFEPNGAINLTNATTFADFAHEIRDKKSALLFMPQTKESLRYRYAENVRMIMDYYPNLGPQAAWFSRIFYQCPDGVVRTFGELVGRRYRALDITTLALGFFSSAVDQIVRPVAPIFSGSDKQKVIG